MAYYRFSFDRLGKLSPSDFWVTVNGNFFDIAVLEWCKLLGDRKDKHFWKNVVTDKPLLEASMLARAGVGAAAFEDYRSKMRNYRDAFVAHLDSDLGTTLPTFDVGEAAVLAYHDHIVKNEATAATLRRLPKDLVSYYKQCWADAAKALTAA